MSGVNCTGSVCSVACPGLGAGLIGNVALSSCIVDVPLLFLLPSGVRSSLADRCFTQELFLCPREGLGVLLYILFRPLNIQGSRI
jgi:hypothetical protein